MREAVDRLWGHLEMLAPTWAGLSSLVVAFVVLVLLRRTVDVEARARTRTPAVFLLAALALRVGVSLAARAAVPAAAGVLGLLAVLCFVVGLVGIAGIFFFDVALRGWPVPGVIRDLAQLFVVAAVFVGILYEHGFDPVSLAATGGVLTAVVGFALQSTIANVFAGLALPLERQLAIGDWIGVGELVGRIREMQWRSTTVVTKDGDTLIVPNNQLLTTTVVNFSRPTPVHRTAIRVGFHYRHAPNEVRRVLLGAVAGAPGVVAEPAPDCFPVDFAESAVVYALRFWVDDFFRVDPIAGEVRTRVWYAARRAGLEIPFPIRTIAGATATEDDSAARRRSVIDRVDIFAPLDGECRTRLVGALRELHFAAGEDIIRQDAPGDSLFFIDRGRVDVRVTVDGGARSVATLGPGQFFGEMSLMTGEQRNATCTALTDTLCWVVDQAAFRCVLDQRPSIADEMAEILANRQTELDARRHDLSAEARSRRARETRNRLVTAIRQAFAI